MLSANSCGERQIPRAFARMSGGENHGKKGPSQSYLPRQIDAVHRSGQPHVGKDHSNVAPPHKHNRKRSFRAFTLNSFQLLVFEQRRCEASQVEIVLDDQYGTAL
jgi:hypothetical protein